MTYEEFKADVFENMKANKPKEWRDGQFIFNFIDSEFGIAREVQFNDCIDCFYNNDKIEQFLVASYKRIKQ